MKSVRQSRPAVVFDLDGTLIDSAPGILASLEAAFGQLGLHPRLGPDRRLIGPPLKEMLRAMAGSSDEQLLARLGAAFKIHYDADGWRQAELFPGVMDLLEYLQRLQIPLYLATNKRMVTTSRIMRHLGLAQFFCAMYSLDSVSPAAPDKASLLGRLLQECRLSCSDAWYVGDRVEDAEAARSNEMPFAAAVWGYGAWTGGETQLLRRLEAPGAMIGLLHG